MSNWHFLYDGVNPSVNFFSELKPLQPVSDHVAEKTKEIFMEFLGESGELVTLDQLGINIPSEDKGPIEETIPAETPMAEEATKTEETKVVNRTAVDEFYRTLMGETNHVTVNTLDDEADLSKAEEMFEADITAVEDSINEIEDSKDGSSRDELEDELELQEADEKAQKDEDSILELSYVEEQLNELGDEFLVHQSSSTIPMPIRLAGAPYLGPFLSTVFGRLEQMPTNSLYLNLMLTGIVTQLGSFSLPLMRGLLLDTRIIFQPGVPTLYQVKPK